MPRTEQCTAGRVGVTTTADQGYVCLGQQLRQHMHTQRQARRPHTPLTLACIVDGGGAARALEAAACRRSRALLIALLRLPAACAVCCLGSATSLLRGRRGAHGRQRLLQ